MKVYLTRVGIENGYEVYKLDKVDITANMLSANSITKSAAANRAGSKYFTLALSFIGNLLSHAFVETILAEASAKLNSSSYI